MAGWQENSRVHQSIIVDHIIKHVVNNNDKQVTSFDPCIYDVADWDNSQV